MRVKKIEADSNALNVPETIHSKLLEQPTVIKLVHQARSVREITFVHSANILAPNARAIVEAVPLVDRRVTSLISSTISASKHVLLATKMSEAFVISSARIRTAKSATRTMFVRFVPLVNICTKAIVSLNALRILSPTMRILPVLWLLLKTTMREYYLGYSTCLLCSMEQKKSVHSTWALW